VRCLALKICDESIEGNLEIGQAWKAFNLEMVVSGSYDGTVAIWKKGVAEDQWSAGCRLNFKETLRILMAGDTDDDESMGGGRIFSVQCDDRRIVCSGQVGTIVGWKFG
jgi:hypothetical protein